MDNKPWEKCKKFEIAVCTLFGNNYSIDEFTEEALRQYWLFWKTAIHSVEAAPKPVGESEIPPHTMDRIRRLDDPKSLNTMLDTFQSDGLPMGSSRWTDYVQHRFLELTHKERSLEMLNALFKHFSSEFNRAFECTGAAAHIEARKQLTREFQASRAQPPEGEQGE